MRNVLIKIGLSIAGLVQGAAGSYFALLGYAVAFPDTEPGIGVVICLIGLVFINYK